MEEREAEKVKGSQQQRWTASIDNLTEMSMNLYPLHKLLINKAVYVDEVTFSKASLT